MAVRPNSASVRADLTTYAHALMQDLQQALDLINLLAPVVPTGGSSGLFNKFDDTQAFKVYSQAVARRAIGGQANVIGFLGDTENYNADPYGLRISIDNEERNRVANNPVGIQLLEEAKTRTLTINCLVAHLSHIITTIKAAVSATSGAGDWNSATVDPIQEINDLIKAVYLATGMIPNNVVFDFGAWCVMSGNAKVLKRMPGADVAQVNTQRIQRLFCNPGAVATISETAILTGGGLGSSSATKQGILGGSVLVFFNSPMATQYDPSFCKTFSAARDLFSEVYSYREEPHTDWYENDWTADVQIVASGLCARIDVTGANS